MATTYNDIAKAAVKELQIAQAGVDPAPEDLNDVVDKLRRLLDNWNADSRAVYAESFPTPFAFTPNLSPHTIGPTGTVVVSQRPETIDGANLVLPSGSTPIDTEIRLRDWQWWLAQSTKSLTATFPTHLYYQPDWPNGKLFFWPVPSSSAYKASLVYRVVLDSQFVATNPFSLPPGYWDAITLTLAESCISMFGAAAQPSPSLPRDAAAARQRVFGANVQIPRIRTADDGCPTGRETGTMTMFNYLSRTWNP